MTVRQTVVHETNKQCNTHTVQVNTHSENFVGAHDHISLCHPSYTIIIISV